MSKGLQLTLVTVAIALMGMSAMAEAPVIDDIPSPIVGGGSYTTPPNTFVYPDAINLNAYVHDDGGLENIVWSYWVDGTAIYNINGTEPLDLGTDDAIDPAATDKDLGTVRNGEEDLDSKAQTITVRNVNLSPLGGDNGDPGSTEGILESETQVVTLFASDGSTYTTKEIMVYTDNGGQDRLSPGSEGEPVYNADFTNDDNGYSTGEINSATVSVGANGICIEVAADNTNIGTWTSPYPLFEMANNSVYQVRATMNGSQTTVGAVPLWDIVIQNYDSVTGTQGANAYLADYLFLDNENGAYAVGPSTGISGVELYFVPLAAKLPSWQDSSTGAFSTANDAKNDIQLVFRMLDASNTGYGGELDFGQVCVQTLAIERFDLDQNVTEGATVMNLAINNTNYSGTTLTSMTSYNWATAGQVTISPTGGTPTDVAQVFPGDGDNLASGGSGAIDDDFPITWEADTIYMVEMSVSAPTSGDESQPVDVIQVGIDPPSWENFMLNTVTRGDGTMHNIGMPKSGTAQTYVTFFKSDRVSMTTADFKRLRPRVQILDSSALSFGNASGVPQTTNTGAFTIHGITVKKVTIQ